MRPILVGIAGGSASGKSTLARTLIAALADRSCAFLCQDHYFRDWTARPDDEAEQLRTANRPEAVLWPALIADVQCILGGGSVELPAPGTRAATRGLVPWCVGAADLLIVEGLFTLWHDELRALCDLRVYVDVPPDERLLRRITRDIAERGSTLEHAMAWYRRDVLPGFSRFTEPTRWQADLIVPNPAAGGCFPPAAVSALVAAARVLMDARRQ